MRKLFVVILASFFFMVVAHAEDRFTTLEDQFDKNSAEYDALRVKRTEYAKRLADQKLPAGSKERENIATLDQRAKDRMDELIWLNLGLLKALEDIEAGEETCEKAIGDVDALPDGDPRLNAYLEKMHIACDSSSSRK